MPLNAKQSGLSVVEVIVAATIITAFMSALVGVYNLYLHSTVDRVNEVKALFLAEEGIEKMRYMRDASWSANIAPFSIQTELVDDSFERVTEVDSGLTSEDKKITVSVSWNVGGATTTRSLETYLANIYAN